ncbi:YihY/virulence factor BrkB family protein [Fulvivirga aurantia]|uniref:YihY/virulence factor BrkB family protein n=1 Tax=Fulvivirga aurantia TaxID=2529383 RepID=UPI001623D977|nr:YihY/virulence factor BrkB family protein [Fulvivirga aurantia]
MEEVRLFMPVEVSLLMLKLKEIGLLFKNAAKELGKNKPIILASSTAFFTIFSIPPIIIITVNALSLYFKSKSITQSFINNIQELFGEEAARQMSNIASNFSSLASQPWITIAGSVFLIFIATNLFNIIKLSINQIWNIRVESKSNILFHLKQRLIALGIIVLTTVLFILSTVADSIIAFIRDFLPENFAEVNTLVVMVMSKIVVIIFIALWFAAVYRFLPDARVAWKPILTGAIVTSVLFVLGKYILERLLINSNIDNIFETSTSIVLIMLFIFYASLIMYYGVSFTAVYSKFIEEEIELRKNAERVEIKAIPKD